MKATVNYGKFNSLIESAVIPIDDERRVIIEAGVKTEIDGEGEDAVTTETKVLNIVFEDDSLSNKVELSMDEIEFGSFIKLLQVMARTHLKVSV